MKKETRIYIVSTTNADGEPYALDLFEIQHTYRRCVRFNFSCNRLNVALGAMVIDLPGEGNG